MSGLTLSSPWLRYNVLDVVSVHTNEVEYKFGNQLLAFKNWIIDCYRQFSNRQDIAEILLIFPSAI